MKSNRVIRCVMAVLAGLFLAGMPAAAQGKAPKQEYVYPDSFSNAKPNVVVGSEYLRPFWTKLACNDADTMKVMMVGDSHVQGRIFPRTLETRMKEEWKRIDFSYVSKNGVQLNYFLKPEQLTKIEAYRPDMLIVSVGTNESHGYFVKEKYQALMKQFTDTIHAVNPECVIVFTTTPGSHIRKYGYKTVRVNKRRTKRVRYTIAKEPNEVSATVSECQAEYCEKNRFALWNLYDIVGGKEAACTNWVASGLMAGDGVHFQRSGYEMQAGLLFEALNDSYKAYRR